MKASIDIQWEKCCGNNSDFIFDIIFIELAGKEDRHKISDEFERQPDWTFHFISHIADQVFTKCS